jgi:hypothetical protein
MPPATQLCITCSRLYPNSKVNPGRLGNGANRYCYRKRCKEAGVSAGHVVSQTGSAAPGGHAPGSSSPGSSSMHREHVFHTSTAKLAEIFQIYGFR